MNAVYVPSTPRPADLRALAISAASVVGLFLILPLLIALPQLFAPPTTIPVTTAHDQPPPAPPPEPDKKIIEQKTIDELEFVPPIPDFDLKMLERLIDAGPGTGTISVNIDNVYEKLNTTIDFTWDEVDPKPRVLTAARPVFPYEKKGKSGEVVVEFIIDANGVVLRPRVYSTTDSDFNQAALDAVKRSRWQAGEINGKAVRTVARVPIIFKK